MKTIGILTLGFLLSTGLMAQAEGTAPSGCQGRSASAGTSCCSKAKAAAPSSEQTETAVKADCHSNKAAAAAEPAAPHANRKLTRREAQAVNVDNRRNATLTPNSQGSRN
jgi:hypothetical protein